MKKLFCCLLLMFTLPSLALAQLTEDQTVLLEDLQSAFEQHEAWTTYEVTYQITDELGWTIFSPQTNQWLTRTDETAIQASIDSAQIAGNLQHQMTQLDSAFTQTDAFIETWEFEGDPESLNLTDSAGETTEADYADYPYLDDLIQNDQQPIPPDLLDHATAIYDLGIEDGVQGYQVILDFGQSFLDLNFDADAFLEEFNGLVELGFLRDSLIDSSTLTLYAYFDDETHQILELSLILEIHMEIDNEAVLAEGDSIFTLDYGRTWSLSY